MIIAVRKPYKIERNATTLNVDITVWAIGDVEPVAQYELFKNSYQSGVPEDIEVDVSPYIRDFFKHLHNDTIPVDIEQPTGTESVNVKLKINGVDELHTAFDGWVNVIQGTLLTTTLSVKNVDVSEDYQYITGELTGATQVTWSTNTGASVTKPVPNNPSMLYVFPVLHNELDTTGATHIFVAVDTPNPIKITYKVYCSFQGTTAIGFINHYGVWEFFPTMGTHNYTYKSKGSEYRKWSDGNLAQYNVNGSADETINTGWVDENFRRVVQQFLVSEDTILYTSSPWDYGIVLNTRTVQRPNSRTDKMLNYTFSYKRTEMYVPIV